MGISRSSRLERRIASRALPPDVAEAHGGVHQFAHAEGLGNKQRSVRFSRAPHSFFVAIAVDKGEGLVKGRIILPVFVTPRVGQRRLRTKTLVSHAESPLGERIAPPTIDTAPYCGHDSSMRTSSRRAGAEVENVCLFSKVRKRRLLHGPVWMRECPISFSV